MALCRQWLDALPVPQGVLKNVQEDGRETLLTMGLPTKDLEAWRLTDLNRFRKLLELPTFKKTSESRKFNSDTWAHPPKEGIRIVLEPENNNSESINLPNGIRRLTSSELKEHLNKSFNHQISNKDDITLAINHAATKEVLALKVEGNNLPPIELIMPAHTHTLNPTRVIILMEEKAQLELLQIALGTDCSAHSHLIELHLKKHSKVNHGFIALGSGQACCLANLSIQQESYSDYSLTSIQHGWSLSRLEPQIVQLNGKGNTTLKGLQVSRKDQQLSTHSIVDFEGPEGSLNQLQKVAAIENSHSIFNGAIKVPQIAQRTNASQLSRNLLLSNLARIDTKPELEIVADDVRCTHGATVSQLQEDELFYLRSRGINAKQASGLLLKGYCQEIIDALPTDANRWDLVNKLVHSSD